MQVLLHNKLEPWDCECSLSTSFSFPVPVEVSRLTSQESLLSCKRGTEGRFCQVLLLPLINQLIKCIYMLPF